MWASLVMGAPLLYREPGMGGGAGIPVTLMDE
jgi:hypothetical protein